MITSYPVKAKATFFKYFGIHYISIYLIGTPDSELVTLTNIIPRPEAANTLNLTLCCSSKVCHDVEPADSTLKAGKVVGPHILCYIRL